MKKQDMMREVAVFAALRFEITPLKALLSRVEKEGRKIPIYAGEIGPTRVFLVLTGVGEDRALAAAECLYPRHCPQGVLSVGFCGGLVPETQPGDVVLGSTVVPYGPESGCQSPRLLLRPRYSLSEVLDSAGLRVHVGGFACVSRPVISPKERRALAQETGAVAVEMETYHLGEFFVARQIPFIAMRTVVDCLGDDLPPFEAAMDAKKWKIARKLCHYVIDRRMRGFGNLWRLYQNARKAQETLQRGVASILEVWP